ncbi:MAG: 23S rRNA (pseudouridine(1915)-N(3))-methyltransferase RlmH [bacterium]
MKIRLLCMGKTDESIVQTGIEVYASRIKRYAPFEIREVPSLKHASTLSIREIISKECELILRQLENGDFVVLLDERGKQFPSKEFASFLNQRFLSGGKSLVFVTGGAFGFDEKVRNRADFILSLSKMTFPHQLVRLIFTEQLYRALTILRNEVYHHE